MTGCVCPTVSCKHQILSSIRNFSSRGRRHLRLCLTGLCGRTQHCLPSILVPPIIIYTCVVGLICKASYRPIINKRTHFLLVITPIAARHHLRHKDHHGHPPISPPLFSRVFTGGRAVCQCWPQRRARLQAPDKRAGNYGGPPVRLLPASHPLCCPGNRRSLRN